MNLNLTDEQKSLQSAVRDFLANECPKSLSHEMLDDEINLVEVWKKIGHSGWSGLIIPRQYGGQGGTFIDLVLVVEEMGRSCFGGPFLSSAVESGLFITEVARDEQKERLLPDLASGNRIFSLALTEPRASYGQEGISVSAKCHGDGYLLNGVKLFVPYANAVDCLLWLTRRSNDDLIGLVVDPSNPAVRIDTLRGTGGDSLCEVRLSGVEVAANQVLGEGIAWSKIEALIEKYAVAKCAEMVGGAQQVLEMASKFCKHRVQFEHHIGSFQAVQHHLANMLIAVEGSRLLTYKAAWQILEGLPCTKQVSLAKAWTNDAFTKVTALGQQLLGGPAFIERHDMPLYYRRAAASQAMFGGTDFHQSIIAREILGR